MDKANKHAYKKYLKLQYQSYLLGNFENNEDETVFPALTYDDVDRNYVQRRRNVNDSSPSSLIDGLTKMNFNMRKASPNNATPMDIDSSMEDQIIVERKSEETLICKTEHMTENKSSIPYYVMILLVLLPLTFILYSVSFQCFHESHLNNTRSDLNEVLYQTSALSIIMRNLKEMLVLHNGVKVLPFIGTTGVGKTLTANIVKRNFPSCVYEINARHHNSDKNMCETCCNLVIFDDLSLDDYNRVADFIAQVPSQSCVLIIPIFNTHSTEDGWVYETYSDDVIHAKFAKAKFNYELVHFNSLRTEMIEAWLEHELDKRGVEKHKRLQVKRLIHPGEAERKGFKGINTKLLLALDDIS